MNNLAVAYQDNGQLKKALPLFEETLAKRKRVLGADHPDTLTSMNNLASAYRADGQLKKALPLLEETVAKSKLVLGADHPNTLTSMNNLALAYQDDGQLKKALPLFEETLAKRKLVLGADHPNTLTSMNNLAVAFRGAGRLPEAIELLEEALERARPLPGRLGWLPGTLAATYDAAGQFAKAEPLYRSFVAQAQNQFGAGDPRISAAQAQLGLNLLRQKKYTDAEPLLRDCLKVRQQKQPDAWTTFNTQSMLGGSLLGQKEYDEAESLLLQGYEGMKQRQAQIPKAAHARLSEAVERLVELYDAWGRPEDAARWRKELEMLKAMSP
jgi:tetratricopeptide (TPR) repeat protein